MGWRGRNSPRSGVFLVAGTGAQSPPSQPPSQQAQLASHLHPVTSHGHRTTKPVQRNHHNRQSRAALLTLGFSWVNVRVSICQRPASSAEKSTADDSRSSVSEICREIVAIGNTACNTGGGGG